MSRGLRRFFIVCAIVVGAGLVLSLAGLLGGGINGFSKMSERYTWIRMGAGQMEQIDISGAGTYDTVKVKGSMNIVVEGSSQTACTQIRYDKNSGVPEYSVKNGVLTVDASALDKGVLINFEDDDSIPTLVISMPENELKKLALSSEDYGDIYISNISPEEISAAVVSGYIEVTGVNCGTASFSSQYGDVDLENIVSDKLAVTAADGNIDMQSADCGSITLSSEYGEIEGDNIKTEDINVKSQQGDVELNGEFAGKTDIYLSYGNLEFNTYLSRSMYTIDAMSDIGVISVGTCDADYDDADSDNHYDSDDYDSDDHDSHDHDSDHDSDHDWDDHDDDSDRDDHDSDYETHGGRFTSGSGAYSLKIVCDQGDAELGFGR